MSCPVAKLLVSMHRGDEAAARLLWSANYSNMNAYAQAILPVSLRSLSADCVQSVFCRLLALDSRRVREIEDGMSFLLSSVRNECISLIRSHRRRIQRERKIAPSTGTNPEIEYSQLHRALNLLPRRQREIVVLKHIADLTFDQIELATGTNRNTAASLYRNVRQQLQQLLTGYDSTHLPAEKEESCESTR